MGTTNSGCTPVEALRLIRQIFQETTIGSSSRMVIAAVILNIDNENGTAWASYGYLRREYGVSTSTIARAISDTQRLGYLEQDGQGVRGATRFRIPATTVTRKVVSPGNQSHQESGTTATGKVDNLSTTATRKHILAKRRLAPKTSPSHPAAPGVTVDNSDTVGSSLQTGSAGASPILPLIPSNGEAPRDLRPIEEAFAELAAEVPAEVWNQLPPDLNENLDHYVYGVPKKAEAVNYQPTATRRKKAAGAIEKGRTRETPPTDRPRNPLWDAVCEVWGLHPVTQADRKAVGRIVSDLTQKGATSDEIKVRLDRYRRAWPTAADTPRALVVHWDYFARESAIKDRSDPTPADIEALERGMGRGGKEMRGMTKAVLKRIIGHWPGWATPERIEQLGRSCGQFPNVLLIPIINAMADDPECKTFDVRSLRAKALATIAAKKRRQRPIPTASMKTWEQVREERKKL